MLLYSNHTLFFLQLKMTSGYFLLETRVVLSKHSGTTQEETAHGEGSQVTLLFLLMVMIGCKQGHSWVEWHRIRQRYMDCTQMGPGFVASDELCDSRH